MPVALASAPSAFRIGGSTPAGIAIGDTIVWPVAPPTPGQHLVSGVLVLISGVLATTALQGSRINDPNTPSLNGFFVGSLSGAAFTNVLRLQYPDSVADNAFPASVTIARTSRPSAAAYSATTTDKSAVTSRGGNKFVDYELPANPVRSAFVQTNDTVSLQLDYTPAPDPADHSYSIVSGSRGGFIGYWDNNIGTIDGMDFAPPDAGVNVRIRQSMSNGTIFRWLIQTQNQPASYFPDRIVVTDGTDTVVFVQPDPFASNNFGQGTGVDYVLESGTIADVFVNNAALTIDLFYD